MNCGLCDREVLDDEGAFRMPDKVLCKECGETPEGRKMLNEALSGYEGKFEKAIEYIEVTKKVKEADKRMAENFRKLGVHLEGDV